MGTATQANQTAGSDRPREYGTLHSAGIRPEMTVRQVAHDFPGCREVFLRYGEPDRAGIKFGHLEPLAHFARRKGLSVEGLLKELSKAGGVPVDRDSGPAERIHRPYLILALLVTLTLGAGWGVHLLWTIGRAGDFAAVLAAHVVAHGAAQLWGFIALFVMGVALRTVLIGFVKGPSGRWLSRLLLLAVVAGLLGGFAWSMASEQWTWAGPASGTALLLAALGFWGIQIRELGPKWRATWARSVLVSGLWLVLWAGTTLLLRLQHASAGPGAYAESQRLLLIELAVFGFALNSIYGFGQMLLPGFLRTGSLRRSPVEASFWLHNLGVLVALLAATGWLHPPSGAASALIAAGALLFAVGLRGFRTSRRASPRPEQGPRMLDRYMQLAFAWLLTALALLCLGEWIWRGTTAVPHAWLGAVRHALTVGFMTTLILGVGQRLLPVLEHTTLATPLLVGPIFGLIALGNLWRVGTELALLSAPEFFALMPISGLLEWTALLLFAVVAVRTMWRNDAALRRGRVTEGTSLAALLAEHPRLEDLLVAEGSDYLKRVRAVPSQLTLGSFSRSQGWNAAATIAQVNDWLQRSRKTSGLPTRR